MRNEPSFIVGESRPVRDVGAHVNLFGRPETGHRLLVELPHFVVLDGKENEAVWIVLQQEFQLVRLEPRRRIVISRRHHRHTEPLLRLLTIADAAATLLLLLLDEEKFCRLRCQNERISHSVSPPFFTCDPQEKIHPFQPSIAVARVNKLGLLFFSTHVIGRREKKECHFPPPLVRNEPQRMKRHLELLVNECKRYTPQQIDEVRRAYARTLDALYAWKASPLTEAVFTVTEEIFVHHILTPLSHTLPYECLWPLKRVNRQWYRCVGAVQHLNFGKNRRWNLTHYERIVTIEFQCVTSLRTHWRLLTLNSFDWEHTMLNAEWMRRIQTLVIDTERNKPTAEEYQTLRLLPTWRALTTFVAPDITTYLIGLEQLTGLTCLDVGGEVFEDPQHLYLMTKLQHLRLRHFVYTLDVTRLPSLAYLDSDAAAHFTHYTGRGQFNSRYECVTADDVSDDDEPGVRTERAALDTYEKGVWCANLDGEWRAGRFTGHAVLRYGETFQWTYCGFMVNHRRHGYGEEENVDEKWVYVGHWANGVRHGPGTRHTCTAKCCPRDYVPDSNEEWTNGVCVSTRSLLNTPPLEQGDHQISRESPLKCDSKNLGLDHLRVT
jgi:hypothetical protein